MLLVGEELNLDCIVLCRLLHSRKCVDLVAQLGVVLFFILTHTPPLLCWLELRYEFSFWKWKVIQGIVCNARFGKL